MADGEISSECGALSPFERAGATIVATIRHRTERIEVPEHRASCSPASAIWRHSEAAHALSFLQAAEQDVASRASLCATGHL